MRLDHLLSREKRLKAKVGDQILRSIFGEGLPDNMAGRRSESRADSEAKAAQAVRPINILTETRTSVSF